MRAGPGKEKGLANRLFAILFLLMFLSFVVATAIAAKVSWTAYEGDAENRLVTQLDNVADRLQGSDPGQMAETLADYQLVDIRMTLVADDGTVLYDNMADIKEMGNHADREEIQAAREFDDSVTMRHSVTTGTDALYAATVVNTDGTVLRLSESRSSLTYYIGKLLLPLSGAILIAALVSALLAHVVTRRITSPLLKVSLDAPTESETYREITPLLERIDAQRSELVSQNEHLVQSDEIRREFTSNVSHEMKSPLQVIGGYAELIADGVTDLEDARRFAGLIRDESQSMRTLIDDVLTLSRLSEGALGEAHPIETAGLVTRVVRRLSSIADSKNVTIRILIDEDAVVLGDEALLEQAVYNLVDNAVRYGRTQVEIVARRSDEKISIIVSDDGSGIPEDQRERIFERFYRIDSSRSRSTGGTGLGLAIVKHAAETMGGCVFVTDSALGGAAFTLELPAR